MRDAIAGFLDCRREPGPQAREFDGFPVVGCLADLAEVMKSGVRRAVVAVGVNAERERIFRELADAGLELVNAVDPSAIITRGVRLDRNVIVAPGVVVGVGSHIHDGVLLNTSSSVDHDCDVGEFAHVCPGTHLAGTVKVGRRAWVGIGASVVQGVTIGDDAFIGAGAAVIRDLPPRVLAYGVPARVIRELTEDELGRIIT
jgi:sugar O-acyltransferase (sialic acid O-acetyltransferase NeuD family)